MSAYDNHDFVTFTGVSSATIVGFNPVGSSNLAVAVLVAFDTALTESVTALTHGGVSMTNEGGVTSSSGARAELRSRAIGSDSSAQDVVVTLSANLSGVLTAVSGTGVNQADPMGALATATGTNDTPSVTVTSAADEFVVDTFNAFSVTATVGAGQTERVNATGGSQRGCVSTEGGASSVTMDWLLNTSYDSWAACGASFKNAAQSFASLAWIRG